jgi:hypothetical protein
MIFYNDFICTPMRGQETSFTGSDDAERFAKNLLQLPNDWIYRNKEIRYKYNSLGFRCKDPSDLDYDNYVLFTGCSHTEGVGLALEDTYPYKIAEHLKTDYINLAIGGTGLDVLEYNLITWLTKYKKKPKYVFIQWPDHSRYMGVFPNYENMISIGSWREEPEYKTFMATGELTGFFYGRKFLTTQLLSNVIDVPILSIQFTSLNSFQPYDLFIKKVDLARDQIHSGIKSNDNTTKQIIQYLSMR